MNKRFDEIEKQSYTEVLHERGGTYMAFDKQKFAQLIVRECVDVVKWTPSILPNDTIIKNIKEHFGVEE